MDWFLYDKDIRHERVKYLEKSDLTKIRSMRRVISYTARKLSVFGVFLIRILLHSDQKNSEYENFLCSDRKDFAKS